MGISSKAEELAAFQALWSMDCSLQITLAPPKPTRYKYFLIVSSLWEIVPYL